MSDTFFEIMMEFIYEVIIRTTKSYMKSVLELCLRSCFERMLNFNSNVFLNITFGIVAAFILEVADEFILNIVAEDILEGIILQLDTTSEIIGRSCFKHSRNTIRGDC